MNNKQKQKQAKPFKKTSGPSQWSFESLLIALVIGLAIGGFAGYQMGGGSHGDSSASAGGTSLGGDTDAYGRSPGHEHYRHNHP